MIDITKHQEDCPMVRPVGLMGEVKPKTKAWYDNMLSGSQKKHNCPCCHASLEFKEESNG